MTPEDLQQSVVLITSSDPNISRFGTGFIIRQVRGTAYLLTCEHVVKDIGGPEKIKVDGISALRIASGEEHGLDLAVLRVDGLRNKPELHLQASDEPKSPVLTAGFQLYDKTHLIRTLRGTLDESVGLQSIHSGDRIQAWDLQIVDDHALQPGYSGSPVVDEASGYVLGVVSHRQGQGQRGLVISLEALEKIWKFVDSEQLYRSLLKLGYQKQVRQFRALVRQNSIGALLIHGAPEYGPRWLLNLLLIKHFPYITNSEIVKVGLARRGRRSNVSSLWLELCRYFDLPKNSSLSEIAQGVYQRWQTQNIILIFHNVDWIPTENLRELIHGFWECLAQKIQDSQLIPNDSKLFLLLVDYDGSVGSLQGLFAESLDSREQDYTPIKAPTISEFSDQDILSWIGNEGDQLPAEIAQEIDARVEDILDDSEGGIPEFTLDEICSRCGCNWFEESEVWLRH